jgi:hypothetical protein
MASRATLAPQMEQPDPLIDRHSSDVPPKPTNEGLELGQEPLSSGPNEGLYSRLDMLPTPRSMDTEGQP